MDFPIALHVPDLKPVDASLRGVASEIVANMYGTVESGILDAEELQNGPAPAYDGIQPFSVRANNVILSGNPTDSRLQSFQDKNGVVALLDDAYGIRPTVILPEGLVSVDWEVSNNFLVVLSGNRQSTFYMYHSQAGMEIDLLLVNNGTNQTVYAWDPAIKWMAAAPPSVPPANSGTAAMLLVTIENINGTMYADWLNYSSASPFGGH